MKVSLAKEQRKENFVEDTFVIISKSRDGMGCFDGAVDVTAVETVLDSGERVLKTSPCGPDTNMEAIITYSQDEVLCINAESLEYISCIA